MAKRKDTETFALVMEEEALVGEEDATSTPAPEGGEEALGLRERVALAQAAGHEVGPLIAALNRADQHDLQAQAYAAPRDLAGAKTHAKAALTYLDKVAEQLTAWGV